MILQRLMQQIHTGARPAAFILSPHDMAELKKQVAPSPVPFVITDDGLFLDGVPIMAAQMPDSVSLFYDPRYGGPILQLLY